MPMIKKKIYIETSVWNQLEHVDRPDWRETAEKFIATVRRGFYDVYVSKVVLDELMETPDEDKRRKFIRHINGVEPVILPFDEEAQALTAKYMEAEFVGGNRSRALYNDSCHVAIATVNDIGHIVSFNCRHLVKDRRIDGFNGVNLQNGYDHIIDITTPHRFVIEEEDS
jgi:predicted nucleic acid-binding protein